MKKAPKIYYYLYKLLTWKLMGLEVVLSLRWSYAPFVEMKWKQRRTHVRAIWLPLKPDSPLLIDKWSWAKLCAKQIFFEFYLEIRMGKIQGCTHSSHFFFPPLRADQMKKDPSSKLCCSCLKTHQAHRKSTLEW